MCPTAPNDCRCRSLRDPPLPYKSWTSQATLLLNLLRIATSSFLNSHPSKIFSTRGPFMHNKHFWPYGRFFGGGAGTFKKRGPVASLPSTAHGVSLWKKPHLVLGELLSIGCLAMGGPSGFGKVDLGYLAPNRSLAVWVGGIEMCCPFSSAEDQKNPHVLFSVWNFFFLCLCLTYFPPDASAVFHPWYRLSHRDHDGVQTEEGVTFDEEAGWPWLVSIKLVEKKNTWQTSEKPPPSTLWTCFTRSLRSRVHLALAR